MTLDAARAGHLRRAAMQTFDEGGVPESEDQLSRVVAELGAATDARERRELCEALADRATVRARANRAREAIEDLDRAEALCADLKPLVRRSVLVGVLAGRAKLLARAGTGVEDLGRALRDVGRLRELGLLDWLPDEVECDVARRRGEWDRVVEISRRSAARLAAEGWVNGEAFARLRTGEALLEMGDADHAAVELDAVRPFFERHGPPDRLAAAELAFARVAHARGEPDEAWRHAERALAETEKLFRRFRSPDDQHRFVADKLGVYRTSFSVALAAKGPAGLWRAWSVAERAKSFYLRQLVANADVGLFDGAAAELGARLRELDDELDLLEAKRSRGTAADAEELLRRYADRVAEHDRLLAEAMRVHPRWAALRAPPPLDLEKSLDALPEGWQVLSYFWEPDPGGAVLHAFLRPPRAEPLHWAVPWTAEEVATAAAHRSLRERDGGRDVGLPSFPPHLAPKVLPPSLVESLRRDAPLLVSPHGELADVALHALPVAGGGRLIERCPVQTIPTLALLGLGRGAPATRGVLALGCAQDGFGSPALPDVPAEVEEVERLWTAAGAPVRRATVGATDTPAGRGAPVESWSGFRVLHIACHGSFDAENPLDAALLLGCDRVRAAKFFGVRLDASLVVLSACDVGRRSRRAGESGAGFDEWAGLYLPLFYAGARAVVASRWKANSQRAARFMAGLHRALAAGESPPQAMRTACRPLLRGPETFWANWTLVGMPETAT